MAVPSRCRAALPHLSAFDQSKIDELCRDALTDLPKKAPEIEAGFGEAPDDGDDSEPRLAKRGPLKFRVPANSRKDGGGICAKSDSHSVFGSITTFG